MRTREYKEQHVAELSEKFRSSHEYFCGGLQRAVVLDVEKLRAALRESEDCEYQVASGILCCAELQRGMMRVDRGTFSWTHGRARFHTVIR